MTNGPPVGTGLVERYAVVNLSDPRRLGSCLPSVVAFRGSRDGWPVDTFASAGWPDDGRAISGSLRLVVDSPTEPRLFGQDVADNGSGSCNGPCRRRSRRRRDCSDRPAPGQCFSTILKLAQW